MIRCGPRLEREGSGLLDAATRYEDQERATHPFGLECRMGVLMIHSWGVPEGARVFLGLDGLLTRLHGVSRLSVLRTTALRHLCRPEE